MLWGVNEPLDKGFSRPDKRRIHLHSTSGLGLKPQPKPVIAIGIWREIQYIPII